MKWFSHGLYTLELARQFNETGECNAAKVRQVLHGAANTQRCGQCMHHAAARDVLHLHQVASHCLRCQPTHL